MVILRKLILELFDLELLVDSTQLLQGQLDTFLVGSVDQRSLPLECETLPKARLVHLALLSEDLVGLLL